MKHIVWLGSSYKDLVRFPKRVLREVGYNLDRLQRGWDPIDWKPMSSIGAGVREMRIHDENEYRVIYLTRIHNTLHVLHVFTKKTRATRQKDLLTAKQRLKMISQKK